MRTPDEARLAVAACRYPPEGIRGYGPRRPSGYGRMGGSAFCKAANQAIIAIAQIEHIDAVRAMDEILAVPGLDAITFGPCDLSGSMGHMGEPKHPEVARAIETILSKARGTKVAIGTPIADPDTLRRWFNQGAQWLTVAGDESLMLKAANEIVEKMRHLCATAP